MRLIRGAERNGVNLGTCPGCGKRNAPAVGDITCENCGAIFTPTGRLQTRRDVPLSMFQGVVLAAALLFLMLALTFMVPFT